MEPKNLNVNYIPHSNPDNIGWTRLKDCHSDKIIVHFEDIENALIKYISQSKFCLGCVAWLTNERILSALSNCSVVSIIVQKEDFLRPDYIGMKADWHKKQDSFKKKIKQMYKALPRGVCQDDLILEDETELNSRINEKINQMYQETKISPGLISSGTYWETDPIRTLGEINEDKIPAFPRMHHKFIIFCNWFYEPYAVWTGSFNFTYNGTQSLENGVYITDKYIVKAYWYEWVFNFIRSEVLDWDHEYKNPFLTIGS
ncbi:phospholipase D-like domain-containing protein [Anabaena sp. CCY 9910]|uniref:phospholipase D-like domain-containing protein n=1 Tax=Anabaena sp. CCY 9910 TaxID=3103870 RepID=UPI0039E166EF